MVVSTTRCAPSAGEASPEIFTLLGNTTGVTVHTYDSAGVAADADFDVIVAC